MNIVINISLNIRFLFKFKSWDFLYNLLMNIRFFFHHIFTYILNRFINDFFIFYNFWIYWCFYNLLLWYFDCFNMNNLFIS